MHHRAKKSRLTIVLDERDSGPASTKEVGHLTPAKRGVQMKRPGGFVFR